MTGDLSLRKAVIGGETKSDDYTVIWDDLPIGRIFKIIAVGGGHAWSWSCFLPNVPQDSRHRGIVPALSSAKEAFRAAWEDLHSNVGYDQIIEARKLAADRGRPWHR